MNKYEYTADMREISGFGGGYEDACRNMVIAGLNWCDEHWDANVTYKEYENIYGITFDESEDCKKMQEAMLAVNDGCSGAQMQASMSHVMAARKLGWEEYCKQMREMKIAEEKE